MFDIGWPELIIIAVVTVVLVGPQELPGVLRTCTRAVRRMRELMFDLRSGFDDLAREAELDEVRKDLSRVPYENIVKNVDEELDLEIEFNELNDIVEKDKTPHNSESESDKALP